MYFFAVKPTDKCLTNNKCIASKDPKKYIYIQLFRATVGPNFFEHAYRVERRKESLVIDFRGVARIYDREQMNQGRSKKL